MRGRPRIHITTGFASRFLYGNMGVRAGWFTSSQQWRLRLDTNSLVPGSKSQNRLSTHIFTRVRSLQNPQNYHCTGFSIFAPGKMPRAPASFSLCRGFFCTAAIPEELSLMALRLPGIPAKFTAPFIVACHAKVTGERDQLTRYDKTASRLNGSFTSASSSNMVSSVTSIFSTAKRGVDFFLGILCFVTAPSAVSREQEGPIRPAAMKTIKHEIMAILARLKRSATSTNN